MSRFISTIAIFLGFGALYVTSCGSSQQIDYDKKLDTIQIMLRHADENLALDPEQISLRIDTMKAQLFLIDSIFPGLESRENEVAMAYIIYRQSLMVFETYVEQFDPLYFENQALHQELVQIRRDLKEKNGVELEKIQNAIPEFRKRCLANYAATKTLIRSYLDVIRPYYRKKKIIDHMFDELVEKNSDSE